MSFKELLAAAAAAAVFAWCALQAGLTNGEFWKIAITAAVCAAVWVSVSKQPRVRLWATLAIVPALLYEASWYWSLALVCFAFLLLVAGMICAMAPPMSTKPLAAIAVGCLLAAFLIAALVGRVEANRLVALRQEYPAEAILERLAYERREQLTPATSATLSYAVSGNLAEWERFFGESLRNWQLAAIHDSGYEHFVRGSGFSLSEYTRPTGQNLRMPPLRDIAFSETEEARAVDIDENIWERRNIRFSTNDAPTLHLASRDDFLHLDGMGGRGEGGNKYAGFVPHAFHNPPAAALPRPEEWTIERLELVSVRRFDEPRVYVLDHLPRMDQLGGDDPPTRALDEFETNSLDQLRYDEDLVIDERGSEVRMLGSLRAAKSCLECHAAKRGDLLGAFTYFLRHNLPGG